MLHDKFAVPGRGKMRKAAGVHTHAKWRREEAPWVFSRYFSKTMVVNLSPPQWDWLSWCLLSQKPLVSYRH